jgi:outer membrane lipoprotein-sorting protein
VSVRSRRLVPLASVAAMMMAAASPAAAQNWFEKLFSGGEAQAPAESAPAPAPSSAPPAPPRPQPPKRPAAAKPTPAEAQAAQKPAQHPAQPVVAAATAPAAAPAPLTERQIVEKANAYFNGLSTLVGDFTQIGGDGRKLTGKLYLSRPGRLRFEYDAPATLEVIADGSSVAVRDRKLATQDLYTIGQTPLKFLLSDRIDLTRDLTVTGVTKESDGVRILMEDRSTLGGTSKIAVSFDPSVEALSQWRVVDPQGFLTTVMLSNVERGRRMDPKLFSIEYQRMDANPR